MPAQIRTPFLEAETEAELACKRARDVGAGRVSKAGGLAEVSRGHHAVEIVAIVCTVCQVEGLRDELQSYLFPKLDALAQSGIQLEERIAAQGIERHKVALSGKVASLPCRTSHVSGWAAVGDHDRTVVLAGTEAQRVSG